MTAIEAVKRRMDKENEWNEEKNKKLKGYLLKGLEADQTAPLFEMQVGLMEKHVHKIKNPKTRKIKGAEKIRDTFGDKYEQQLLKFPTAEIVIDSEENAIKVLKESDPNYALY